MGIFKALSKSQKNNSCKYRKYSNAGKYQEVKRRHSESHISRAMKMGFRFTVQVVIHIEALPPLEQDTKNAANAARDEDKFLLGTRMA